MGRKAAARINEALLAGQEPLQADLDAVRYALDQARRAEPADSCGWHTGLLLAGLADRELAAAELCSDAHRRRRCRKIPTRASARVGHERRRPVAWRGRTDAFTGARTTAWASNRLGPAQ